VYDYTLESNLVKSADVATYSQSATLCTDATTNNPWGTINKDTSNGDMPTK